MVQSSIVVPSTVSSSSTTSNNDTNISRKRSIDTSNKTDVEDTQSSVEPKRPRIEDNEAGKNRNRRLFGALLGTLNRFKTDTEKTSEIDKNRREIDKKLHEKLEAERRELQEKLRARREEKERKLEEKYQEEQRKIREKKELHELRQKESLVGFLKTKTEPSLCWLPEKLTDEMESTLKRQKEDVSEARKQFDTKTGAKSDKMTDDPLPCDDDTPMTDDEEEEKGKEE